MDFRIKKFLIFLLLVLFVINFERIALFGKESVMMEVMFDNETKCYKWPNGNNSIYGLWQISAIYFEEFEKLFTKKNVGSQNYCLIIDKTERNGKITFINKDKIADTVKFNIVRDSKDEFHIKIGDRIIFFKATVIEISKKYCLFFSFDKEKISELVKHERSTATNYQYVHTTNDNLDELEGRCIKEAYEINRINSDE